MFFSTHCAFGEFSLEDNFTNKGIIGARELKTVALCDQICTGGYFSMIYSAHLFQQSCWSTYDKKCLLVCAAWQCCNGMHMPPRTR